MQTRSTTASLGKELASKVDLRSQRLLLVRAQDVGPELANLLKEAGAKVDSVSAYRIMPEGDSAIATFQEVGF